MDLTSLLNTTAAGTAVGGKNDEPLTEAVHTPSATSAGSTAPSSTAVTPLLEQTSPQRVSEPRTGSRNRTPWDAGGFSLSRALDAKQLMRCSPGAVAPSAASISLFGDMSSPQEPMDPGDSSPKSSSSRHRFSDSRSSLSSSHTLSSSTTSLSHSRLSSLSTVSENQPLTALITDFSQLENQPPDSSISCYAFPYIQYYSAFTQSPENSEDFRLKSPTPIRSRYSRTYEGSPDRSPTLPDRAQSPSDAVLIPRAANDSSHPSHILEHTRFKSSPPHSRSHSRSNYLQRSGSTRRHKRAASAPDFPSIGASTFDPHFPTFGPIPEPTPSPSQHSDGNAMDREISMSMSSAADARARSSPEIPSTEQSSSCESTPTKTSPTTGEAGPSQSRPSADMAEEAFVDFETASACMYRGDCQTGSQLRKAISHIFGRNKLCTRMIPTGVWVHYCRKHYQRTRYRNGGEYPQRQIGLVQEQVKRVQAWSDSNIRRGSGPILKDWSLSVRKREQMRLDSKLAANGKKRPFHDEGEGEEDEGFDEDRADLSGTAVPDWVISRIGDGYSTIEILSVVERLKADIDQGRLQQIPDIEILPNISTEDRSDDGANAKKSFAKRRATGSRSNVGGAGGSGAGHRRSQSVNAAGLSEDHVAMRRCSQPSNFYMPPRRLHNSELQQPLEKRQRIGGERNPESFESFDSLTGLPPTGPLSRPSLGGRMQLTHRPAFGEIRESRAEAQDYQPTDGARYEATAGGSNTGQQQQQGRGADMYEHERGYGISTAMPGPYSYGPCYDYEHQQPGPSPSRYSMLPAPNPLRHGGASVAQRLESSSYALNSAANRRGSTHQRSQSEAVSYHHISSPHDSRPTSSSGFPPLHAAPLGPSANTSARFGQDAAEKAPFGYGSYQTQNYGQSSRHEDGRPGSLGGQQPYGYTKEADHYERYDNVRLPPLQSLPLPHSHQRYTSSTVGGGFGVDRKYRTATEYPETARHVRHQSSPVVPRLLPSPMEIGAARRLPEMGRPLSPRP